MFALLLELLVLFEFSQSVLYAAGVAIHFEDIQFLFYVCIHSRSNHSHHIIWHVAVSAGQVSVSYTWLMSLLHERVRGSILGSNF